jgi:hypothetical protein
MAPYYINDDNAECSGWAVEKEDGEVMGCHTTKQDAIDQAVAIARAEDSEFIGERAMPGTLSPGDFVTWKENGETYNGRIREIVSAGLINIPGSGVQVEGTYFDPAAMVQMWEQDEDGWRESSTFLGLKFCCIVAFVSVKYNNPIVRKTFFKNSSMSRTFGLPICGWLWYPKL